MSKLKMLLVSAVLLGLAGCGGSTTSNLGNPQKPLDPQGNWVFNFSGTAQNVGIAGQLFELTSPVVTSNGMAALNNACTGSFTVNGQASGTDTINLTLQQTGDKTNITASLTGTIAADQQHMNGTWTITTPGPCFSNTTGMWTAQLLTPVTGSWTGTVSNTTTDLTFTSSFTENTDQTSQSMGQVTGTVTLLGTPCFPAADTFNLGTSVNFPTLHAGERLIINPPADANNVTISAFGDVAPDATQVQNFNLFIHGGVCDGQSFTGTLTH